MQRCWYALWLAVLMVCSPASAQIYQLQPGDQISISVLEDPALNRSALIGPDGRITMPLVGSVIAANRTAEEVAAVLRQRLAAEFVEPPTVTVSLNSLAQSLDELLNESVPIYIIGEVGNPGLYEVDLPINVLQALALAGGPSTFAARKRIQVRRQNDDGTQSVLIFNYEDLERGYVPSEEISLSPGDVVVIPERRFFE